MRATTASPLPGTQHLPFYPASGGRRSVESAYHGITLILLRQALEDRYARRNDVYVSGSIMFYFNEGDPTRCCDPDGLVARGVCGNHLRLSFRTWEEGVVPCVLFEIVSEETWRCDVMDRPTLYAGIGVKEYFAYDPEGCFLDPVLLGWKTVKGEPAPMKLAADGSLVSRQLGLRLAPEGEMLRLIDLKTGKPLLTRAEMAERQRHQAAKERKRRLKEQQRADEMQEEVERLRAELKKRQNNKHHQ